MRLFLTSTFIFLFTIAGFSQQTKEHFRGGMLLHAGYIENNSDATKIKGNCTGIGGKIVFPVAGELRLGTEGYVSNFNYKNNDGFYKLGWGGLLIEYKLSNKRLMPVAGVTIGGGKVRDLFPVSGDFQNNFPDVAIYKVYSTMIIAPQLSLEYSLTSHVNLVGKVDYLFYPGIDYPNYISKGPRVYVGFLFSR